MLLDFLAEAMAMCHTSEVVTEPVATDVVMLPCWLV